MTHIMKFHLTPRRRANLAKLADYLESLPKRYKHFEMETFLDHKGECDLSGNLDGDVARAIDHYTCGYDRSKNRLALHTLYTESVDKAMNNCGTVACAVGHGPAAGVPFAKAHVVTRKVTGSRFVTDINWAAYASNFVPDEDALFDFLFGGSWTAFDNHHWGAAARIRYVLDKGGIPSDKDHFVMAGYSECIKLYKPYRVDQRLAAAAS